ncbi:MAG: cob(I)yrinic acid a,c-diamide adenosyltransferase [Nitrospirae bacterium]|nr:cob(I)yrinic acid a,c-diamide adenosyltransferase [Nitrospirota bacterium]
MGIDRGLTHIYTGFGKGKTSAAFGLALRALGRGNRVLVFQFLKGGGELSGEAAMLKAMPGAELVAFTDQRHPIFCKGCDTGRLKESIGEGFRLASDKARSGEYDLVVMDEINNCMKEGWLDPALVVELIRNRPDGVELVLTGRGCPDEVIDAADYVTDMNLIKHPAEKGIMARRGVEY